MKASVLLISAAALQLGLVPVRAEFFDVVPGYTPSLRFSERYAERVKRTVTPGDPETGDPPFVEYNVVSSTRCIAQVVANIAGLDLSAINETTEVSVTIGAFNHTGTLGESNWKPGRHSARFRLTEEVDTGRVNADGDPIIRIQLLGKVTYVWSATRLRVIVAGRGIGTVIAETKSADEPGTFYEPVSVNATFAGGTGMLEAYARGSAGFRTVTRGRGDNAQSFELHRASSTGTLTPPPDPGI